MYGTTPDFCEASLTSYVYYLASPVPLAIDSKTGQPIMATSGELKSKAKQAMLTFVATIVVFRILESTCDAPFPNNRPADSVWDYLHRGSLLNNYCVACK